MAFVVWHCTEFAESTLLNKILLNYAAKALYYLFSYSALALYIPKIVPLKDCVTILANGYYF